MTSIWARVTKHNKEVLESAINSQIAQRRQPSFVAGAPFAAVGQSNDGDGGSIRLACRLACARLVAAEAEKARARARKQPPARRTAQSGAKSRGILAGRSAHARRHHRGSSRKPPPPGFYCCPGYGQNCGQGDELCVCIYLRVRDSRRRRRRHSIARSLRSSRSAQGDCAVTLRQFGNSRNTNTTTLAPTANIRQTKTSSSSSGPPPPT